MFIIFRFLQVQESVHSQSFVSIGMSRWMATIRLFKNLVKKQTFIQCQQKLSIILEQCDYQQYPRPTTHLIFSETFILFQNKTTQCLRITLPSYYYLNSIFNIMKKRGGLNQHYICQGCKQSFGSERIPRLLPICGHTLCENCIEALMETRQDGKVILKCVVDGKIMEFEERELSNFPKNFAMLKTIEKRQMKQAPPKEQQPVPASEKMQELQDTKSEESDPNLIFHAKQFNVKKKWQQSDIDLEDCTKYEHKKVENKEAKSFISQQDMCLIHYRPLQIVCLKDSVMICSNCALFGQHRNHQVKPISDIKKDVVLKQQEFLEVIDEKEQMQSQFYKSIGQQEISRLLQAKKENVSKQIQQYFDKLIKRLRMEQKKLQVSLQQASKIIQRSFRDDSQKAAKKFSQFRQWERSALDYINILEGQDLQKKLTILDYETSKSKIDPIEEGYRIIDDSIKLKGETQTNWENILSNFHFQIKSQQIEAFIGMFSLKVPTFNKKQQINNTPMAKITQHKPRQSEALAFSSFPSIKKQQQVIKNFCSNDDLLIEMQHHVPNHINIPQLEFDVSMNMDYNLGQPLDISKIEHRQSSFIIHTTPFDYKVPKSPPAHSNRGVEGKKKLKPVKVPAKYEKMMESLVSDSLDVLDFTNSQLGNQEMAAILQHLKNKKVKTVKLIRCKLTDDILNDLWSSMSRVISLNLSQNAFSDRIIDSFLDNTHKMPHLRFLTLSQNKINQRNVKNRIDEAKKMDIIISL